MSDDFPTRPGDLPPTATVVDLAKQVTTHQLTLLAHRHGVDQLDPETLRAVTLAALACGAAPARAHHGRALRPGARPARRAGAVMSRADSQRLDKLAASKGYRSGEHAAAEVLHRPLRDVRRHGLSEEETETVIEQLRDKRQRQEAGMGNADNPGNPDRTWAIGTSGLAAGAWMWAGSGVGTWLVTGFAALLVAGQVADFFAARMWWRKGPS